MLTVLCLAVSIAAISAYPSYQPLVPNGDSAPNPCGGGTWPGLGHLISRGTGPLNPFGTDFAAAGHAWTKTLCMKDSDGDGKSNGEELGDPHCHWTPVSHGNLGRATGHPGICENDDGTVCAGKSFHC